MPWYQQWWEDCEVLEYYGLTPSQAVEAVNALFFAPPDDDAVDLEDTSAGLRVAPEGEPTTEL